MGRVLFLWMMMLACALALTPATQAFAAPIATQETALTATQAAIPEVTVQQPAAIVAGTVIDAMAAMKETHATTAFQSAASIQTAMSSVTTEVAMPLKTEIQSPDIPAATLKAKEAMAASYSVTPEVVAHAEIVYIKPIIATIVTQRMTKTAPLVLLC